MIRLTASAMVSATLLTGASGQAMAQASGVLHAKAGSTVPSPTPDQSGEIVVTGSLLRSDPLKSSSPIQIVTFEDATQRGLLTTADALLETSVIGSHQQTDSASLGGSAASTSGFGATTLGLRGLGAARTLILINGRRAGPTGTGGRIGSVTLNTIPSAIVSETHILTNGASSIYGSDAVAGVANIVTQQSFDGARLYGYSALTEGGGGNYHMISGRFGRRFSNGSVSVAASWQNTQALFARQRNWSTCDADYVFDPNTGERADITSPDGSFKCWGSSYLYKNKASGTGSAVGSSAGYFKVDPAAVVTTGNDANLNGYRRIRLSTQPLSERYDGYYDERSGGLSDGDKTLKSPSNSLSVYFTADKEVSDTVELYTEVLWNRRRASQDFVYTFDSGIIPASHPLTPFNYANNPAYVNAAGAALRPASSRVLFLFQQQPRQQVHYLNSVFGARGRLTGKWDWNLFGNLSWSSARYGQRFVYGDRMDAARGADGCDESLLRTAEACPAGGIDFWRAQREGFTPEETAFLVGRDESRTRYKQVYVEGIARGPLFTIPHGDVELAAGFHWRREKINDQPGQDVDNRSDALNFDPTATPTVGSATVRELFAETSLPLLRDAPFAEWLNVSISGRLSDFQYGGTSGTYKIALGWMPSNWLMFRATRGTSYRSPKLYELFLKDQSSLTARSGADACYNYKASSGLASEMRARCETIFGGADYQGGGNVDLLAGGNTALNPETSVTHTAGFVITPAFAKASLSVDLYDIKIRNSVTRIGASRLVRECLAANEYPGGGYCDQITRAASGELIQIKDNYLNTGNTHVRGLDFVFSIEAATGIGKIGLRGDATVQLKHESAIFPGDPAIDELGYVSVPKFLGNVSLWYAPSKTTRVTLGSRLIGATSNERYYTGVGPVIDEYRKTGTTVFFDRKTGFYRNFSLSFNKQIRGIANVTLGARNLFDVEPPKLSQGGASWAVFRNGVGSGLPYYDDAGRTFYLTVDKRF